MGSNRDEYLLQAEQCQQWAANARTPEQKARWLELAAKWRQLADETTSKPEGFHPVVHSGGAGRKRDDHQV